MARLTIHELSTSHTNLIQNRYKKFMKKKHITSIALIISTLLISCEKDPEIITNYKDLKNEIIGKWYLKEYITKSELFNESASIPITQKGKDYNYSIEFLENPQSILTNGSYKVIDIYNFEGADCSNGCENYVVNSNSTQQEGPHIGKWDIENGYLISKIEDDIFQSKSEIIELTADKLILKKVIETTSDNIRIIEQPIYIYIK